MTARRVVAWEINATMSETEARAFKAVYGTTSPPSTDPTFLIASEMVFRMATALNPPAEPEA